MGQIPRSTERISSFVIVPWSQIATTNAQTVVSHRTELCRTFSNDTKRRAHSPRHLSLKNQFAQEFQTCLVLQLLFYFHWLSSSARDVVLHLGTSRFLFESLFLLLAVKIKSLITALVLKPYPYTSGLEVRLWMLSIKWTHNLTQDQGERREEAKEANCLHWSCGNSFLERFLLQTCGQLGISLPSWIALHNLAVHFSRMRFS